MGSLLLLAPFSFTWKKAQKVKKRKKKKREREGKDRESTSKQLSQFTLLKWQSSFLLLEVQDEEKTYRNIAFYTPLLLLCIIRLLHFPRSFSVRTWKGRLQTHQFWVRGVGMWRPITVSKRQTLVGWSKSNSWCMIMWPTHQRQWPRKEPFMASSICLLISRCMGLCRLCKAMGAS